MGRSILGVVVGYVATVVVVLVGISLTWVVLGGEGSFAGEGPFPSTAWIASALVFGLIAAFVGGLVARKLGRSGMAVKILVGIILVLGGITALMAEAAYAKRDPVDKPVAEMSLLEAGEHAKNPTWYNWVIPLIGASGALVGGREREA